MRAGQHSIMRFWSSMFSIYRILKCSSKTKTDSITNPFTGEMSSLLENRTLLERTKGLFFNRLSGYSE